MDCTLLVTAHCDPTSILAYGEIARYENEDGETIELLTCDDLEMLMDCFDGESGFKIEIDQGYAKGENKKKRMNTGTPPSFLKGLTVKKLTNKLHKKFICGMAFSNDETKLVTTGKDSLTLLYDIQREKVWWSYKGRSPNLSTSYSPIEDQFIVGEEKSRVRLFDATDITRIKKKATFTTPSEGKVYGVDYFSSGNHFSACGTFEQFLIYDISTGAPVVKEDCSQNVFVVKTVGPTTVAYAPDADRATQTIESIDIRGTTNPLPLMRGHTLTIWSLDVSDSGNEILSTGMDGTAIIFDIRTGNTLSTFNISTKAIRRASFINDDVIATCGRNQTVDFWDTASGDCVNSYEVHSVRKTSFQLNMCCSRNQLFCSSLTDLYHVSW
eukprot:TRINITY_DN358_c5_g2_i1.p1 TRINITY_DN358_c5_g2~~TRINITY_DN358_c5_g2_i1.p1  ORF type:complete len:405 (+),score=73.91 TRINITY_DN358_c5_g2_i1:67-1215(+)